MLKPTVRLCLLPLLWLVLTAAAAGEEEGGPEEVFVDSVNVHLINVDVRVTDKRGQPILGLEADDFRVFENGRPVEVTNFYAIEGRRVRAGAAEPAAAEGTLPTIDRLEPLRPPEDQQLHLVIYVDNVNIHPNNRRKGFSALRSFIRRRVTRDDQVMVVSYDRSLNERQAFTDDKELVIEALDELETVAGHRVNSERQRSDILNDIYDAEERINISGRAQMYVESAYHDVNRSIDALRRVVDSLAGLPGRKAVLYLSDGIEMRAGEDIFYAIEDKFEDTLGLLQVQSYDVSRRFRELTREAGSNRVTFYALDAAGLRTHSSADVTNYQAARGSIVESTRVANLQEPLQYLAGETGGQAIVNTNNFGPMLERVGNDLDSYYSLGYPAAQSGSGRYREIKVELAQGKGLRLRHRQGYRDKSIGNRMAERTRAALTYGYAPNDLGLDLEFGPRTQKGEKTWIVPLVIKIPMAELAFVPREEKRLARLRLYIAARDEEDGVAPVEELAVPIEIPGEALERARAQAYHLQHTLLMAPGRQVIAIGVRDEIGAVTSFLLSGVRVGV